MYRNKTCTFATLAHCRHRFGFCGASFRMCYPASTFQITSYRWTPRQAIHIANFIFGSILNPPFIITSQRIEDSHEEQIANIKRLHMCLINNTKWRKARFWSCTVADRWHYAHDMCMRIESIILLT